MPEKFKAAFNVGVAIPAWSLICALAIGIFSFGAIYQKLNTLVDSYQKTADKVASISDQQISSGATIANIQAQQQSHESRITALERATWESRK